MGFGMDEMEMGCSADEEVLDWERDKALESDCIVVGYDTINPMTVAMNRLVGLRRKYKELLESSLRYNDDFSEFETERFQCYYDLLDNAFEARQAKGERCSRDSGSTKVRKGTGKKGAKNTAKRIEKYKSINFTSSYAQMKCHCGKEYQAKVADLRRGWATSCSKRCAAIRREFGRPCAELVE